MPARSSPVSPIRSEIDPTPLLRKLAAPGCSWRSGDHGGQSAVKFRAGLSATDCGAAARHSEASADAANSFRRPAGSAGGVRTSLGHRIGSGAGHYDRTSTIARMKAITAIGLGFAAQEVEAVGPCCTSGAGLCC